MPTLERSKSLASYIENGKNIIRPKILIIVDIVRGVNLLDTNFPNIINNVSPKTAPNTKRFPNKELVSPLITFYCEEKPSC